MIEAKEQRTAKKAGKIAEKERKKQKRKLALKGKVKRKDVTGQGDARE